MYRTLSTASRPERCQVNQETFTDKVLLAIQLMIVAMGLFQFALWSTITAYWLMGWTW